MLTLIENGEVYAPAPEHLGRQSILLVDGKIGRSGGYNVPPTSIMSSVREDMMFIDEVIGAREIAIADERATEPSIRELAKLVVDTRTGGKLSKKAGVTHFHIGPGKRLMKCLEEMLDSEQFEIDPCWLYPASPTTCCLLDG